MPRTLDYPAAESQLETEFIAAEPNVASGQALPIPEDIAKATEQLMRSATQAYREVLIGCCLARIPTNKSTSIFRTQARVNVPIMGARSMKLWSIHFCNHMRCPRHAVRSYRCSEGV